MGYRIVNGRAYAVGNFFNLESEAKLTNGNTGEVSFNDVLNNIKTENEGFILSKHACKRFNEISFSRDDMNVINNGFDLAKEIKKYLANIICLTPLYISPEVL